MPAGDASRADRAKKALASSARTVGSCSLGSARGVEPTSDCGAEFAGGGALILSFSARLVGNSAIRAVSAPYPEISARQ
jgi:hypothetical protein